MPGDLHRISEEELMSLAAAGEEGADEALAVLFQKKRSATRRLVRKRIWNREDADDVASEVWVRILKGRKNWGGKGSFDAWLATIAKNEAVSHRRRKARRHSIAPQSSLDAKIRHDVDDDESGPALVDLIPDNKAQDPMETLFLKEFRAFMYSMPGPLRDALFVHFDLQCTYEESSRLLCCSQSTASKRVREGKRLMREWLESQL